MKTTILFLYFLIVSPALVYSQHFEWTVLTTDGLSITSVHPDTIRGDVLSCSQSDGVVQLFSLDSVVSLTYSHNPTFWTLTIMGGMIGALSNNNILDQDNTDSFSEVGFIIGAGIGAGLSYMIGDVQDEIMLTGVPMEEKKELIRKRVPRRSGRVVIIK